MCTKINNIVSIFYLHKNGNFSKNYIVDNTPENYDDYCINITNEFNAEQKLSLPFDEVYAINIFPHHSFIFKQNIKDTKIATYYIIAYNKRDGVINIFCDHEKYFKNVSHALSEQIQKYNSNNNFKIEDIQYICENLAPFTK